MRFRTLDELIALGLLEPKPPDPDRVRRWLERSRSAYTPVRRRVVYYCYTTQCHGTRRSRAARADQGASQTATDR